MIHLVVRYADRLHSVGNTILRHEEVIDRQGAVWFGKFGRPLAAVHISKLGAQIREDLATYVYFVERRGGGYRVHQGALLALGRELPPAEAILVPDYYTELNLHRHVGLWAKFSQITAVDESELDRWLVQSSGSRVRDVLRSSMAAMFVVSDPQSTARTRFRRLLPGWLATS